MKKWMFIGGGIVVIIIIALIIGVSNLGPIIKSAVNSYGPEMTQTEVSLDDVDISLFSAEAKLKNLSLGNPKGFNSPQAIKVGAIHVNVDKGSLTGDTIIIDRIEVVRPDITYERKSGTDNFQAILYNVKKAIGIETSPKKESEDAEQSSGGESGKKLLIRNFIVEDGKVNLAMGIIGGKSISAPLPDMHLKDIGKEKGGTSPAEAFSEIFAALYASITSPSVTGTLNDGLKAIGSNLESVGSGAKKVGQGAVKELEDVGGKLKGLFGK